MDTENRNNEIRDNNNQVVSPAPVAAEMGIETGHHPTPRHPRRRFFSAKTAIALIVIGAIITMGARAMGTPHRVSWDNGFSVARYDNVAPATEHQFAPNITSINITANSANIDIVQTNASDITVTTSNIAEPSVTASGNHLTIATQATTTISGENISVNTINMGFINIQRQNRNGRRSLSVTPNTGIQRNPRVRVYLPAAVDLSTLDIRTTSGTIRIDDTAAGGLTLRSNSGNIHLNRVTGNNLTATQTSGTFNATDASFDTLHTTANSGNMTIGGTIRGDIYAQRTSGNIRITNQHPHGNNLILHTNSGNINYQTASPFENLSYSLRSNSGNIHLDNLRTQGRGASGTVGNGNHNIDIRVTSGNARLNFNQ